MSGSGRQLIKLYSSSLLMSIAQGMVIPTVPLLSVAFDVSAGLAAQVVTANAAGRAVFLLPAGLVVDRLGSRLSLLVGPLLVTTGAFMTAFSPVFGLVLAAQLLAGAGDGFWFTGREIAGLDLVQAGQRGRLMSGLMGASSAGMAIGPVLGRWERSSGSQAPLCSP